jgi:hypothetical protein
LDGKQERRDKQKVEVSKSVGITVITIPYWWRHSEDIVRSRIAAVRPDIFPFEKSSTALSVLRDEPPRKRKFVHVPLKPKPLTEKQNPTGWYVIGSSIAKL